MRFSIDRANLVRACSHLAGIYVGRSTIPIANNVMLEADGELLTVTANNYSQSMSITVPARIAKGGATTVEYHKLKSIADASAEGAEIDFSYDEEDRRATVRAGRGRYNLFTLPAIDFPVFAFPDNAASFTLHGAELERLLGTGYIAPEDKTRGYINGVHLHAKEETIAAVTTDGDRLSYAEIPMPEGSGDISDLAITLPNEAVKVLNGLLSDDSVRIDFDDNKLAVTIERGQVEIRFATKLVYGSYPDYERVIPPRSNHKFVVSTEAMMLAVKRAMIVRDDSSSSIRLSMDEGKVTVSGKSHTGMEAADEVDCDWAYEEFQIFMNGNYLAAALKNLNASEVEIMLTAPDMPIRIEVPGDNGRRDIVAPMRG